VKSWLLAAKIAAVFMLVMLIFVSITLHLFAGLVLGDEGHGDPGAAHHVFVIRVLQIGLVAMVLMIAFSVYVTAPLRRMSRSMDRIAAGDLEHRVPVRGRDEGAAMGRSFNAMAERVRAMVVGQKELMAGVSHELRSPLTRMKLALELLREGQGAPAERIAGLEADVDALDDLVEELLLASRIDLGAVPLAPEVQDLADLCREAWTRVKQEAEAQGTALQLRCADDARQVLADRSRSRKTGAGGLGLMIVRRAVEAQGGSVRARLADPRGLAVTFDLPVLDR